MKFILSVFRFFFIFKSNCRAGGLRWVRPYYFTFTTHAKGRWVGERLAEVFAREFRAMSGAEYSMAIQRGLVRVNSKTSSEDYRVQSNDVISHTVHRLETGRHSDKYYFDLNNWLFRHELPVTDERIRVVADTAELVVVDKPGSIPVHPCGRYRHNSLVFILAKELGHTNLHTVHRLDRLTSGVTIFCKETELII